MHGFSLGLRLFPLNAQHFGSLGLFFLLCLFFLRGLSVRPLVLFSVLGVLLPGSSISLACILLFCIPGRSFWGVFLCFGVFLYVFSLGRRIVISQGRTDHGRGKKQAQGKTENEAHTDRKC